MANNDWYRALTGLGILMQTPGVYQESKRQMDEEAKIKKDEEAERQWQANIKAETEALNSPLPDFLIKGGRQKIANDLLFQISPETYAKEQYRKFNKPAEQEYSLDFMGNSLKFNNASDYLMALNRIQSLQKTPMGDLPPDVFKLMQKDPNVLLQFFGHDNAPATYQAAQDLGFLPQPPKGDGSSVQYYDVTLPDGKKVKVTGNEYLNWYNKQNNTALTASDYDSILQVMRAKFPKLALGLNWDEELTKEYGDFDTIFKAIGKSLYPQKFVTNKPQSGMDDNNQIAPEDEDVF